MILLIQQLFHIPNSVLAKSAIIPLPGTFTSNIFQSNLKQAILQNHISLSSYLLSEIFNEMFEQNINVHSYYTRQRNKLHVPKYRLNITLKHVSYLGVILWNAVFDKTDINCSIVTFKQRVKRFSLYNAYSIY